MDQRRTTLSLDRWGFAVTDVLKAGRLMPRVMFALGVAALFAACSAGPIAVPDGAQEVHVVVSGDSVTIMPATIRAGDAYIILDVAGTSVTIVEPGTASAESPSPFTDDDLDRVRHGDTFLTSIGGFADGEPHGNVIMFVLAPGRYAFLADNPETVAERWGGTIPAEAMGVLTVLP